MGVASVARDLESRNATNTVEVTGPSSVTEDDIEAAAKRFRQSRTALSDAMREDLGLRRGVEFAGPPKRAD